MAIDLLAELAKTEIEGYELGQLLGKGGEGIVVKANFKPLDQPRAVKLVLNSYLREIGRAGYIQLPEIQAKGTIDSRVEEDIKEFRSRLVERELPALLILQGHDGFVKPYDSGQDRTKAWLAIEFVDGYSCRDMLDNWNRLRNASDITGVKEQLSPDFCSAVVLLAADALSYAHSKDLVYYDVKPDNILISRLGQPKITDCGMSRVVKTGRDAEELIREAFKSKTAFYSAPERNDKKACDERSNVFSLGTVLYELMTGQPPFGSRGGEFTPESVAVDMSKGHFARPQELGHFEGIIAKCLAPKPESRYQSMAELRDALLETRVRLGYNSFPQLAIRNFVERYEKLVGVEKDEGKEKASEEEPQIVL